MPKLKIDDISIRKRHREDLGDIASLAKSIEKYLLHPPIVTDRNELVAGFRRIKAAESLGWTEIEVRVVNPEDLLQAEHDENECRKDFTPSERFAIAESIRRRLEQGGQLATGEKARDKASQAAGFSSTTDD